MATDVVTAPTPERADRSKVPTRRRRKPILPRVWHFASFGAPGVLIYLCFVMAPILISFGYSLTNYNPFNPPTKFVGLENYKNLFSDETFLTALWVTTVLTLIVVIVPNVLGLGIALLLDKKGWLYNALRTVFFTPVILSSVVVSIIWQKLLDDQGPVNQALRAFGVEHPPGWLSDPDIALYSVASIVCWQMLGFCVVVYLAGLQGVPAELLEAAEIDGAGPWRRFRAVTWPLLAPSLTINTVVMLISAFKTYDYVKVITNGGPGSGTTATIAFNVLATGLDANHAGYASAMAVVMLTIVAVVTTIVLQFLRKREVDL
ncbi:multiple sugar transport system permease protein [Amycolatopsis xylanica]|uniref:Multiple sugar transport system permease protein n=1 Tax=Amycolatopsis xylanica TaxID=589385 RepID=A0A1H2TI88_9PSEU|nr:sugar ABC transporter permease [Amycolatopsis xylanica]SDW42984.1 multiple sugar transport system permease protein [Amycolatopsis xylanica]